MFRYLILLLTLLFILPVSFAKRLEPATVPPISYHGILYTASFDHGGIVTAHDKHSNIIWKKRIYSIQYDPNLETDVQDIHIKKLFFKKGRIFIQDEKDRCYLLNLKNHAVTSLASCRG